MMQSIFGIIGELIPIIGGVYCVLYYGGYKTPKAKNDESLKKFNEQKEKHGKKFTILGYLLIAYGLFNIIRYFI
ncbi:hypothetical protein [Wenyingzhuangia sp. 2_MG-2023]|uniref:hypothetical protein n=1 Tax=Wenyingzhuangia sp. 2_MG-2023 TaxID=3062639 RepID=UPI0026E3E4D1|nr:hypothetical protein [Wenyingzhuangia sp. 2_MG-2023]MDO6739396.1 hypothetical protein [Wenyingzhuangia sp. 2_MG-2023]